MLTDHVQRGDGHGWVVMNAFRNLMGAVQNTVKTVVGMGLGLRSLLPKTGRLWTPRRPLKGTFSLATKAMACVISVLNGSLRGGGICASCPCVFWRRVACV